MNLKIVFLAVGVLCMAYTYKEISPEDEKLVPYPEGYRRWTHVKTGVNTPKTNNFATMGGFHHIYANPEAMEGLRTGKFPEGSVFAFDKIEMIENNDGTIKEGKRKWVDVMIKDKGFALTGGWGYEEFAGESKTSRSILKMADTKCYSCHLRKKEQDFVFSSFRQ